jgi:hypothetical protein
MAISSSNNLMFLIQKDDRVPSSPRNAGLARDKHNLMNFQPDDSSGAVEFQFGGGGED